MGTALLIIDIQHDYFPGRKNPAICRSKSNCIYACIQSELLLHLEVFG